MKLPDFRSRATRLAHILHTKAFYDPRCVDPGGGFYHFYKEDGTVYDARTRHLVSSNRFVFNYALAYRQFGEAADGERMRHALAFLRGAHCNPASGGYAWELHWADGKANAPFTIGVGVYRKFDAAALRSYYFQRSGIALAPR
jgi:mannose/cellobiose epimerase-like protein (N-acyl-D-glucosamine 2-epimerase family)